MNQLDKTPLKVVMSLRLLKEKLEATLNTTTNKTVKQQTEQALAIFKKHPILATGAEKKSFFLEHQNSINQLMSFLFPSVLTTNEIKAAVTPYTNEIFYTSARLETIIKESKAGKHLFSNLYKENNSTFDLFTYTLILNFYYNYNVDFERPKTVSIINANGVKKLYRITYNADFIDIYPNDNAIEITKDILDKLLSNADNIDVWETYFPENSWSIEGFGIVNLIDTSVDEGLDDFKAHLIEPNAKRFNYLVDDIRRIFNIPNLQLGSYKVIDNVIIPQQENGFNMLTILPNKNIGIDKYACNHINNSLFKDFEPITIPNVESYSKKTNGNRLSKILLERGLKSVALIPVSIEGQLGFVLELGAFNTNQLNAINMVKLESIIPFLLSYSKRIFTEYQNEISAVIQQQCTAIHPSLEWRFIEEAKAYIKEKNTGNSAVFKEVVFKEVVPLFGQIDVVGSSKARNNAVKQDLIAQLEACKKLIIKYLPYLESYISQINDYLLTLNTNFKANTEQEVNLFLNKKLFPLFNSEKNNSKPNALDNSFLNALENITQNFYSARCAYEDTLTMGNKALSVFLEKRQQKAQTFFPHYFEKYKTDGVDYSLYVGQSITKELTYNPTVLFNLRLWQLQVACELEAIYYNKQKNFPLQLKVASLILAYNEPITIRYRIDEKQFDVDGAYNVRYEMIKKRIDKAHIKHTKQRLTEAHKLSVVYTSKEVEREYLAYFNFLKSKNYIGPNIDVVEVEELQGVSGLKAIRADLNKDLKIAKTVFTIQDTQAI